MRHKSRLALHLVLVTAFAAFAAFVVKCAVAQELAIPAQFDAAGLFHEGVAAVRVDGRWGFIDKSGTFVVKPRYEGVLNGSGGRFGVLEGGRWGYISTTGRVEIQPAFEDARPFNDGVAAVRLNGLWGYLEPAGRFIQPPAFDQASAMDSGFSLVVRSGRLYVYHRHQKVVTDAGDPFWSPVWIPELQGQPAHYTIQESSGGRAIVKVDGNRYFVGAEGEVYGPYEIARPYSEGLAAVRSNSGQWVFIYKDGLSAIEGGFEGARDFSGGVAPVEVSGKWGYIDKWGRFVLKPKYDKAYSFSEGYAVIRNGNARGFLKIDGDGKISEFVAPRFEDVFQFSDGLAPVKVDGKWGYLAAGRTSGARKTRGIVDLKP